MLTKTQTVGRAIQILGWVVLGVGSIWGTLLCFAIVLKSAGSLGLVVSIFFAPITYGVVPFYAGFALHDWLPLAVGAGGNIAGGILSGVGGAIAESGEPPAPMRVPSQPVNPDYQYEIVINWSESDQTFIAEVPELAGCVGEGPTHRKALDAVEIAIREWIQEATEIGREIPSPFALEV